MNTPRTTPQDRSGWRVTPPRIGRPGVVRPGVAATILVDTREQASELAELLNRSGASVWTAQTVAAA